MSDATTPAAVNSRSVQSFASSFWTPDYLPGITVLFDKLDQGVAENNQVVNYISARISLESAYASNLQTSSQESFSSKQAAAGFNRDEGASLKQAFQSIMDESNSQADEHARIAANLERMVRGPFSQYAGAHKQRVSNARSTLVGLIKDYQKAVLNVNKAQQAYFTKSRQLEDFSDPTISSFPRIITSPAASSPMSAGGISLTLNRADSAPTTAAVVKPQKIDIAHLSYTPTQFATLLTSMLGTIPQETLKVAILGAYENVTTGEEIVRYVRKYLSLKSLGEAEKFGQGLVDAGFLRLVGAVGSRFSGTNSSKYQWQAKAFNFNPDETEEVSDTPTISRTSTFGSVNSKSGSVSRFSMVSGYISGLLSEEGEEGDSGKTPTGRESQMSKLQREIADADQRYQDLVNSLDLQRCQLEQTIYETLGFVQQCERDRLVAVKTVLRDFGTSISKSVDTLNKTTSRMLLHEEFIDPLKDLNYLIERYKTGSYAPTPIVYDNFFNATKIQSFGVELKYSAFFVPAFLDFLSQPPTTASNDEASQIEVPQIETTEPDNEDTQSIKSGISVASDKTAEFPSASKPTLSIATSAAAMNEANKTKYRNIPAESRSLLIALWTAPQASAVEIQKLRGAINTGKEFNAFQVLGSVPFPIVVSTLKEFLLELPDSIVSSTVYDVIKTTYAVKPNAGVVVNMDEKAQLEDKAMKLNQRVERLVGLLSHLPKVNIDVLHSLTTHFAEICDLPESSSDSPVVGEIPESVQDLVRALSSYILRPRTTTALSMTDKHPLLFLQDLIMNREAIFTQIQRKLSAAQEARTRSRSASSSEANRRFQIEARNRELAASAVLSGASAALGSLAESGSRNNMNSPRRAITPTVSPPTTGTQTLRPLALSSAARSRGNSTSGNFLSVEGSTEGAHALGHRRSFSSSNRPPLSMFLSPEVPRREKE